MGAIISMFVFVAIFIGLVIYFCFIRPIAKKSEYNSRKERIHEGMSESELYSACGKPTKIVNIDDTCKLVTYVFDEWKGIAFSGTKRYETTCTIKNGKVTNVSESD